MMLMSTLISVNRRLKPRTSAHSSFYLSRWARVEKAIAPNEDGQVYFEGTYWRARFYDPDCQITVAVGDKVQVVGRDRLPLLVVPL